MENKQTLRTLFESGKADLASKLQSFSLPKDAKKVQSTVTNYFNQLFDSEGEYRQHLTQSEDYIFQAAMSLLNAQQAMANDLIAQAKEIQNQPIGSAPTLEKQVFGLKREQYPMAIGGSAVGSYVGGCFGSLLNNNWGNTWGAVFGAIAGTALSLYYASQPRKSKSKMSQPQPVQRKVEAPKMNTETFLSIIGSICDSMDALIETFRSQIHRVIDKYESMEKPTIEKEYRFLLEGVQSLAGYKRTHDETDEKYLEKLQTRVEDLAETLENYNLTLEDYTEENDHWFEKVESNKTTEVRMVYPAVVKNGKDVVLKGKVFIPE